VIFKEKGEKSRKDQGGRKGGRSDNSDKKDTDIDQTPATMRLQRERIIQGYACAKSKGHRKKDPYPRDSKGIDYLKSMNPARCMCVVDLRWRCRFTPAICVNVSK
jgi:hypothetical protein